MFFTDKTTTFLNLLIVYLLSYHIFIYHPENPKYISKRAGEQYQIIYPSLLLSENGQINETGWSLNYLKKLNLENLKPFSFEIPFLKNYQYKKIDYFAFQFGKRLFQIRIANLKHSSFVSINFYDFETNEIIYQSIQEFSLFSLSHKLPLLADDPFLLESHDYSFFYKKLLINVGQTRNPAKNSLLNVIDLNNNKGLKAKLMNERFIVQNDFYEIIPTNSQANRFVYSLKSYESSCEGFLTVGGKYYSLLSSNCVSVSSFTRGLFNFKTNWSWVSAFGRLPNGVLLSINFGGGIGHLNLLKSGEDFFKLHGKIHKLSPVITLYENMADPLADIKFKTHANFQAKPGLTDVLFSPSKKLDAGFRSSIVFSFDSEMIFGIFKGSFVDESGVVTLFEGIQGFMERVKVKW